MSVKNKKLIDLYKEWMGTGKIYDHYNSFGNGGLCNAAPRKYKNDLLLFTPDILDVYWASMRPRFSGTTEAAYNFNPLRQTIVLLICAMHNEL